LEEEKNFEYPFVFIDESGTSGNKDNVQPYFGVGFLKINNPIEISKRLMNIICNSKTKARQRRKELREKLLNADIQERELDALLTISRHHEYHFSELKKETLADYCRFIETFFEYSFSFHAIIIDKKYIKLDANWLWSNYVKFSKLGCDNILTMNERATIIADFMNAPNTSILSFEKELLNSPRINNVMRLQSEGTPLLQICDLFLGSTVFYTKVKNHKQNISSDCANAKLELCNYVISKINNNDLSENFTFQSKLQNFSCLHI
jgi:hypothetical protein